MARSAAGYADRDAFCLLLGIVALYAYVRRIESESRRAGMLWVTCSGVATGALGLSWEGAGIFVVIIVASEALRFLVGRYTSWDLAEYVLWSVLTLGICLMLTRAYRVTANASSPYHVVTLGTPALSVLALGSYAWWTRLSRRVPRKGTWLVGALCLTFLAAMAWALARPDARVALRLLADNLSSPLGNSRLMSAVAELGEMNLTAWIYRFGLLYGLGVTGAAMVLFRAREEHTTVSLVALLSFVTVTISAYYVGSLDAPSLPTALGRGAFWVGLVVLGVSTVLLIGGADGSPVGRRSSMLLMWFAVGVALARGAVRYEFFLAVPLCVFAGHAVAEGGRRLARRLLQWMPGRLRVLGDLAATGLIAVTVAAAPAPGHALSAIRMTRHLAPTFGVPAYDEAFEWMRENLPDDAVVAASWDYGSYLNVRAGCATIVDEDHFIPYWIHLSNRHFLHAQSDREALEFLATRGVTHVMLTERDVEFADLSSKIGSDADLDRRFTALRFDGLQDDSNALHLRPTASIPATADGWEVESIDVQWSDGPGRPGGSVRATVKLSRGLRRRVVDIGRVVSDGADLETEAADIHFPGALILLSGSDQASWTAWYVSEVGYRSLLVRRYLLDAASRYFERVTQDRVDPSRGVKVWKVSYPDDLEPRPEYSATDFPTEALKEAWLFGR